MTSSMEHAGIFLSVMSIQCNQHLGLTEQEYRGQLGQAMKSLKS